MVRPRPSLPERRLLMGISAGLEAQTTGIAACDDFLKKYEACVTTRRCRLPQKDDVPGPARAMRKAWAEAAKTPAAKASLEDSCNRGRADEGGHVRLRLQFLALAGAGVRPSGSDTIAATDPSSRKPSRRRGYPGPPGTSLCLPRSRFGALPALARIAPTGMTGDVKVPDPQGLTVGLTLHMEGGRPVTSPSGPSPLSAGPGGHSLDGCPDRASSAAPSHTAVRFAPGAGYAPGQAPVWFGR